MLIHLMINKLKEVVFVVIEYGKVMVVEYVQVKQQLINVNVNSIKKMV